MWDLGGKGCLDMRYNGREAWVFGGVDPDVDAAVKKFISTSISFTLKCPEEVELSELLCALGPWAEMG